MPDSRVPTLDPIIFGPMDNYCSPTNSVSDSKSGLQLQRIKVQILWCSVLLKIIESLSFRECNEVTLVLGLRGCNRTKVYITKTWDVVGAEECGSRISNHFVYSGEGGG